MKKTKTRLSLSRETVRGLSSRDLGQAAGGFVTVAGCIMTIACPTLAGNSCICGLNSLSCGKNCTTGCGSF